MFAKRQCHRPASAVKFQISLGVSAREEFTRRRVRVSAFSGRRQDTDLDPAVPGFICRCQLRRNLRSAVPKSPGTKPFIRNAPANKLIPYSEGPGDGQVKLSAGYIIPFTRSIHTADMAFQANPQIGILIQNTEKRIQHGKRFRNDIWRATDKKKVVQLQRFIDLKLPELLFEAPARDRSTCHSLFRRGPV